MSVLLLLYNKVKSGIGTAVVILANALLDDADTPLTDDADNQLLDDS